MKKIIIFVIIGLFLVPFFSHSIRYFKQVIDEQKKVVFDQRQAKGGILKDRPTATLLKSSNKTNVSKEKIKVTLGVPNTKSPGTTKNMAEEVRPKEQNIKSGIHDEILSYRLNSKDHITHIQTALKKAGFYKSEVDGKIGRRTKSAIKSFQKSKGLTPDGIVGTKTWEELKKYLKD